MEVAAETQGKERLPIAMIGSIKCCDVCCGRMRVGERSKERCCGGMERCC
jgi:hypothetical protein